MSFLHRAWAPLTTVAALFSSVLPSFASIQTGVRPPSVDRGTLLVSEDNGKTWRKDPVGSQQPTNFSRIAFLPDGKGFVLGERGSLLRWVG